MAARPGRRGSVGAAPSFQRCRRRVPERGVDRFPHPGELLPGISLVFSSGLIGHFPTGGGRDFRLHFDSDGTGPNQYIKRLTGADFDDRLKNDNASQCFDFLQYRPSWGFRSTGAAEADGPTAGRGGRAGRAEPEQRLRAPGFPVRPHNSAAASVTPRAGSRMRHP